LGFFLLLGFWTNFVINYSFGGDLFWGWSTGACLSLPASILTLSRIKRPTRYFDFITLKTCDEYLYFTCNREKIEYEESIKSSFKQYAEKRLRRLPGKSASEITIIQSFRRSELAYRSPDDISDKDLRKIIRGWVGYKPNMEGDFLNIEIINRKKEADAQIALKKQIIASQISVDQLISSSTSSKTSVDVCDDDDPDCLVLGEDFMRGEEVKK
jgi:hypothetical protein